MWNGDRDRALADCTEAIRINPKLAEAYEYRAVIYWGDRMLDNVIADLTRAIRLDSGSAELYYNRGTAFQERADHHKAIAEENGVGSQFYCTLGKRDLPKIAYECTAAPPSTTRVSPWTMSLKGLARNRTALATSSALSVRSPVMLRYLRVASNI